MKQHPIRKMKRELGRCDWDNSAERAIARHVKPLLDALAETHEAIRESYKHDVLRCDYCRLLAAWRAKL